MSSDLAYKSATELLRQMREGSISSRAILECFAERVQAFNPKINAIVACDWDAARRRADAADAARRRGESWGPLHGLPMTIKDTYEVAGMPCTAGAKRLRHHRPTQNAVAVQRLLDAGAIIFGKTNVPKYAANLQTYNQIFGTTKNPWNLACTPGGSSGGAAAALAAGLTPLELGSDIGGSIRTPAHYCGVFGHKSTYQAISLKGHIPAHPDLHEACGLWVGGPLARSASDLDLVFKILAEPDLRAQGDTYSDLRQEPRQSLRGARILAWFDDPLCPIDHEILTRFRLLCEWMTNQGAVVTEGSPLDSQLADYFSLYLNLLGSVLAGTSPRLLRKMMNWIGPVYKILQPALGIPPFFDHYLRGAGQSTIKLAGQEQARMQLRERLMGVFEHYDVILAPITPTTAYPYQQILPVPLRSITVNGLRRHYTEQLMWICVATLLGLPSTSVPVGMTAQGMPFNLQVIGSPLRDLTTIRFAELIGESRGGFVPPREFSDSLSQAIWRRTAA